MAWRAVSVLLRDDGRHRIQPARDGAAECFPRRLLFHRAQVAHYRPNRQRRAGRAREILRRAVQTRSRGVRAALRPARGCSRGARSPASARRPYLSWQPRTSSISSQIRAFSDVGEINLGQWRCLAELVDNGVDGFLSMVRAGETPVDPEISINLPMRDDPSARVTVSDNGSGGIGRWRRPSARAGAATRRSTALACSVWMNLPPRAWVR